VGDELVCGDDGSTDGTRVVLETIGDIRASLLPRNHRSARPSGSGSSVPGGTAGDWTDTELTCSDERGCPRSSPALTSQVWILMPAALAVVGVWRFFA
jgi:hypothetical protein